MSTSIKNLSVGCTGQQLVDKINEIISAVNGIDPTTNYENLTNKPSINGVTLLGNKNTAALLVAMSGCTDYSAQMATLATKSELSTVETSATNAATQAATALVNGKIPSDSTSVSEATMLNEEAFVYVTGPDGLKKVSIKNLTKNVDMSVQMKSKISETLQDIRQKITLTGAKDGSNTVFAMSPAITLGTSEIYVNGARKIAGTDYIEDNNAQITTLTFIPAASDVMTMIAVSAKNGYKVLGVIKAV